MNNRTSHDYIARYGLLIVIIGLLLILAGAVLGHYKIKLAPFDIDLGSIVSNLGSFVALLGLIEWAYDNHVKAKFFDDIFKTIVSNESLRDSGIARFYSSSQEVDWKKVLGASKHTTMCMLYSSRILKDCFDVLCEKAKAGDHLSFAFLQKDGATIEYIDNISKKYESPGLSKNNIMVNLDEVDELVQKIKSGGQNVKVYEHDSYLKYSFVSCDDGFYIIMNTNSLGRASVPAIKVSSGPLARFIQKDIEQLLEQSREKNKS